MFDIVAAVGRIRRPVTADAGCETLQEDARPDEHQVRRCSGMLELATRERLREAAMDASSRAYCPYSHFPVGAAVLVEGGEIVTGCNVENASYSLTICAERTALFAARAAGHLVVHAVGIYTPTAVPTTPCGACRQVLVELAPNAEVFCWGTEGDGFVSSVPALLPAGFSIGGS
jgi:cytidine deaminase